MTTPLLGIYYKTEYGADMYILKMKQKGKIYKCVQCHGGNLVVTEDIYSKYFKK